jgi:hypothetical protein
VDENHDKISLQKHFSEDLKNVVYLTIWMEGRLRKKLGMVTVKVRAWAVNMKQDGSCGDIEADR